MDPFVREERRSEGASFLNPRLERRDEISRTRQLYFQLFNKRLRSVITEGQRRGCISLDVDNFRQYVDPSNIEQMGVNAESLRTLALRYRADQ